MVSAQNKLMKTNNRDTNNKLKNLTPTGEGHNGMDEDDGPGGGRRRNGVYIWASGVQQKIVLKTQ